jgi:hypothetical protein
MGAKRMLLNTGTFGSSERAQDTLKRKFEEEEESGIQPHEPNSAVTMAEEDLTGSKWERNRWAANGLKLSTKANTSCR